MDNFFRLFRYLAKNKHRHDENNSYNVAFDVLDPVVDLIDSLSRYGQKIHETGGFGWDDADKITERIITAHRVALFEHAGQSKHQAILDLVEEYFTSKDATKLIDSLTALKAQIIVKEEATAYDEQ